MLYFYIKLNIFYTQKKNVYNILCYFTDSKFKCIIVIIVYKEAFISHNIGYSSKI